MVRWLVIVLGMALSASAFAQALVVDEVVARVDAHVITRSELTAEARLMLMIQGGPGAALRAQLTPGLLSAVLDQMVQRVLLLNERRRLKLGATPDAEVAEDVEKLVNRFESRDAFRHFLVDIGLEDADAPDLAPFSAPAGLVERLRVQRQVADFEAARIRLNIVIGDTEVRGCFDAFPGRFAKLGYDTAKAQIKLQLRQQKEQRALADLIEQLKARARIRVAASFQPSNVPAAEAFTCPERSK